MSEYVGMSRSIALAKRNEVYVTCETRVTIFAALPRGTAIGTSRERLRMVLEAYGTTFKLKPQIARVKPEPFLRIREKCTSL